MVVNGFKPVQAGSQPELIRLMMMMVIDDDDDDDDDDDG